MSMQRIGINRRIEKVCLEFQSYEATKEEMDKFLELWKKLNPKVYEVLVE